MSAFGGKADIAIAPRIAIGLRAILNGCSF
jgi:hypothetical protein